MVYIQNNIIDLLIRIKNGQIAKKKQIFCQKTNKNENLLKLLELEGYISTFWIEKNQLKIALKYTYSEPVVSNIILYSKPSKKIYITFNRLKKLIKLNKIRTIFLHTNKGIITNKLALKSKIGGELICKIE